MTVLTPPSSLSFQNGLFHPCFWTHKLFADGGIGEKIKNRMTNIIDPDETSHLDRHCLQKHLFWSTELKKRLRSDLYECFKIFTQNLRSSDLLLTIRISSMITSPSGIQPWHE